MIAAAPADAEAAIGWTELDDISQAGLADADENREYSFEEADAATLAELGLLPSDEVSAAPAPEASKPRRGRKPVEAPVDAEAVKAPKPRRGRTRPAAEAKVASEDASASTTSKPRGRTPKAKSDDTPEAAAPKPRTRSRAKPATEPAPAEGAEEGIWQRFRGARTKTP